MEYTLRSPTDDDQRELGRMAGALVRMHHALDPQRFFLVEPIEEGYGRWLSKTSKSERSIVLLAEDRATHRVVGYAWATLEERDWMMLLDACAALQDIWVDEDARRHGVARGLVEGICARAKERGAPRVVLSTAAKNETAQRFFESMGFRRTMIEMTRELPSQ